MCFVCLWGLLILLFDYVGFVFLVCFGCCLACAGVCGGFTHGLLFDVAGLGLGLVILLFMC